jgi:hypothetical protein
MLLNTRKKNIYGLGVGISTVFKIFSNFNFLGGGVDPRGHDLHTIGCPLTQGTRIYMVLGWGSQQFSRYSAISHSWGVGLTPGAISNIMNIMPVTLSI